MHETLSQHFTSPPSRPPIFLVGRGNQEGRAQLHDFLFPCASGSGSPLMMVISGRKGKEGAKGLGTYLAFFLFFFLRQAREGEWFYFWK